MRKCKGFLSILSFLFVFVLAACGQDVSNESGNKNSEGEKDKLTIGLSVSDLTLERWQHDRDFL